MEDEELERVVEEGIEAKGEIVHNFMEFLASMEEEAEIELDGLKLKIGNFLMTLEGDVDLKIEVVEG